MFLYIEGEKGDVIVKRKIVCGLAIIMLFVSLNACASKNNTDPVISEKKIGTPFSDCYDSISAQEPRDMIIFDNKLFIGSGDYDKNCGPAKIACYDLKTNEMSLFSVPDEQISNFSVINGRLTSPGIDPMDDWSLGNYYVYIDNKWEIKRNIPRGIHTFFMIEFENKIFAALGTDECHFPIVVSHNGGNSFYEVKFEKNGQTYPVFNSLNDRVYNMFVLNEKLYAVRFSGGEYEVFVYEYGVFQYVTAWMYDIVFPSFDHFSPKSGFSASITHNGTYYFSTGYLFKTNDAKNIEYVELDGRLVIDLYENNGILYALAIKENPDDSFTSAIYQITEKDFIFLFEVANNSYASSLAVENNNFYIGFGYNKIDPMQSGRIILYKYKGEK